MNTAQLQTWSGEFGREYSERNYLTLEKLDDLYIKNYGCTKRQLNERFLAEIPRSARILEVGCNVGNQLLLLQEMGFKNLHGIEIQEYAVKEAKVRLLNVEIQQASAFQIPYPAEYFDLVFTAGVLIHIAPTDLPRALAEIHRCSSKYIWGHEYFSQSITEVNYRGHEALLWKASYSDLYLNQFQDLELIKQESLPYLENSNVDCVFLLRKKVASFG